MNRAVDLADHSIRDGVIDEAALEAPAQAELRPTSAGAFPNRPALRRQESARPQPPCDGHALNERSRARNAIPINPTLIALSLSHRRR